MQIDINYVRAYIYYLLITKIPNKKYQTVSKKTIDIIINELKECLESEYTQVDFVSDEIIEDNFNQIFYSDEGNLVLKKDTTHGLSDLSIFLLCAKARAAKHDDLAEVISFDNCAEDYFSNNWEFINSLSYYDDDKITRQIKELEAYYRYIQNAYNVYYISSEPIMHQRYKLAEIIKRRNQLLEKLVKDSVVYDMFQSEDTKECSFLDQDFCKSRLKEDSALYNIKNSSKNRKQNQVNKLEFLLYVDNLQQRKYHDNIREVLTGGILDDYPDEKKYLEIQSIANSIISENLFFYRNEEWLDQEKVINCDNVNPVVIYEIWKGALTNEIKSILSISDDEYRNNGTLFAKKLNSTMAIKSFADLSPNIYERINQYLSGLPEFYHSSHKIGRTLLRDFSNLGGNYDRAIRKMITKD